MGRLTFPELDDPRVSEAITDHRALTVKGCNANGVSPPPPTGRRNGTFDEFDEWADGLWLNPEFDRRQDRPVIGG